VSEPTDTDETVEHSDEAERAEKASKAAGALVERRGRLGKILIACFVALIVVVNIVVFTSRASTNESNETPESYRNPEAVANTTDYLQVRAEILEINPVTASQTVRLLVIPKGNYATNGTELAVPINLDATGYSASSINLKANEIPPPVTVSLSLVGDVSQYPFDSYDSILEVTAKRIEGGEKTQNVVPTVLTVESSKHDWSTGSRALPSEGGTVSVELTAERGLATVAFALFQLSIMLLLAVMAVAMTYAAIVSRKPLEFSLFVWLVAMLFALPAIRNTMPGVPGVGTIGDYAVFFWCLVSVACCLVTAALTYIRASLRDRREHHDG